MSSKRQRIDLVASNAHRCAELAEFHEAVCVQPLSFDGPFAIQHSANNHTHLWALEWWAERLGFVDLDYRVSFVEGIFARWRGRLKGLPPYRAAGYRFYLYEDLAPTVSAVAETAQGCPYGGPLRFVGSIREVMAAFDGRSWAANFQDWNPVIGPARILAAVEKHAGSIGTATSASLGVSAGRLRVLIDQLGLEDRVNALRKRFKRRPVRVSRDEMDGERERLIYELKLPAGYK
ncbi:MAG: hypothetical protein AB7E80_00410 [Hyphomicrobiaceae bacterium]